MFYLVMSTWSNGHSYLVGIIEQEHLGDFIEHYRERHMLANPVITQTVLSANYLEWECKFSTQQVTLRASLICTDLNLLASNDAVEVGNGLGHLRAVEPLLSHLVEVEAPPSEPEVSNPW